MIELVRAIRNLRGRVQSGPRPEPAGRREGASDRKGLPSPRLPSSRPWPKSSPWCWRTDAATEPSADQVVLVLGGGDGDGPPGRGFVDVARERDRLKGELDELNTYRDKLSGRLSDQSFLSKAPEDVVERERERLESAEQRYARVAEVLARMGEG